MVGVDVSVGTGVGVDVGAGVCVGVGARVEVGDGTAAVWVAKTPAAICVAVAARSDGEGPQEADSSPNSRHISSQWILFIATSPHFNCLPARRSRLALAADPARTSRDRHDLPAYFGPDWRTPVLRSEDGA